MTKNNKVMIGKEHDRLTPAQEIEILKLKNGTRSGTDNIGLELTYSYTGGLGRSMFENINPDWIQIRNVIETYFVNLFTWNGVDDDFKREVEKILFRHGKVAIIQLPNKEFVPVQFTYEKDDEDFYGNPKKITIVTTNNFNGRVINKGKFVIIYNNHIRHGTMTFLYERLRQTVRALRDVDNNSLLSRPKWGANVSSSDQAWVEILNAMNSDNAVVPLGNIDFIEAGMIPLNGEDRSQSLITTYDFQLKNMLKLIGLQVNGAKLERQTELEVTKNDEFDGFILEDMGKQREQAIDKLNEIGLTGVTVEMNTEDEEDEVNGEVNKKLQEAVNEE